jgi:uncharacterized membrane protein YvbJ
VVCPSCQLANIQEDSKICPRCGEVLTAKRNLSEQALELIKEKSILKGNIAEYQVREKSYQSKISQLKTYIVLLILVFPISRFLCNRSPQPTVADFSSATLNQFASEQLAINSYVTRELLIDEPTFLYITNYGDNPESLSKAFYKSPNYADTILVDNYISNERRIPTGDTLILRKNPKQILMNAFEKRALQKQELKKGQAKNLYTLDRFSSHK